MGLTVRTEAESCLVQGRPIVEERRVVVTVPFVPVPVHWPPHDLPSTQGRVIVAKTNKALGRLPTRSARFSRRSLAGRLQPALRGSSTSSALRQTRTPCSLGSRPHPPAPPPRLHLQLQGACPQRVSTRGTFGMETPCDGTRSGSHSAFRAPTDAPTVCPLRACHPITNAARMSGDARPKTVSKALLGRR